MRVLTSHSSGKSLMSAPCLKNDAPAITVPEGLRLAALKPLERMLEMSKSVPMSGAATHAAHA